MEFATAVGCAHHLQCSACNWAVHEEEPILRLDVSVDEAVLVHVVDRPEHLLDDDRANLRAEVTGGLAHELLRGDASKETIKIGLREERLERVLYTPGDLVLLKNAKTDR